MLQERERGSRNAAHGFRKLVWKEQYLVLREQSVELFKTSEMAVSHGRVEMTGISKVYARAQTPGSISPDGPGFVVLCTNGSAWDLRTNTEQEAAAWILAVEHNIAVVRH